LQTTESECNLIYPMINKPNYIFVMADILSNFYSISSKRFDRLMIEIPHFTKDFNIPDV
jgi:hypothetical protein